ncbi:MAG: hypothetical protein ACRCUT_13745, partial [Spirochaetota bacterium]
QKAEQMMNAANIEKAHAAMGIILSYLEAAVTESGNDAGERVSCTPFLPHDITAADIIASAYEAGGRQSICSPRAS